MLVGVTPQCDHGRGMIEALAAASVPETPTVLTMPVPPVLRNGGTAGISSSSATDPRDDPREGGSRSHQNQQEESQSLCCNTHSGSDVDLVSSRQYLSDMSTASSMDHLSLLGESN